MGKDEGRQQIHLICVFVFQQQMIETGKYSNHLEGEEDTVSDGESNKKHLISGSINIAGINSDSFSSPL